MRSATRLKPAPSPRAGAQGRGGQFLLVFPQLQMVAVFTGWNDDNGLREQPLDMLQRFILPTVMLQPPVKR